MPLSVILVNYKMREELLACLESLARDASGLAWEAVVVDNDSRDGSQRAVAQRFPAVRYVANPANVGYAKAVNRGLSLTTGPYVLVMNPDCVVERGALGALMAYLDAHAEAAVMGPQILDGRGHIEY